MYPYQATQAAYQQPYGSGYPPSGYPPNPQAYAQVPPQMSYAAPPPGVKQPTNDHQSGPPNKKQKSSGTVVTRYPPPPGYQAPGQAAYPPSAYQAPGTLAYPQQAGYQAPGHANYPGFVPPPPGYAAPPIPPTPGYPPQPYQHLYGHQPPTAYTQRPGYPHQPAYGPPPPYQGASFPTPSPSPFVPPPPPGFIPPVPPSKHSWSAPSPQPIGPVKPPSLQQTPSLSVTFAIPSHSGTLAESTNIDYAFELDFEDEEVFGNDAEEAQPEFNLGTVVWTCPVSVKTPLPATFADAELEVLAPAKPREAEDESISQYYINSRKHEAGLCIKQTTEWESRKDEMIFREFPAQCEMVSLDKIKANRYRIDTIDENDMIIESTEPAELDQQSALGYIEEEEEDDPANGDQAMDFSSDTEESVPPETAQDAKPEPSSLFDNLEQALGSDKPKMKVPVLRPSAHTFHSKAGSRSISPERRYGRGSRSPQRAPSKPPISPGPKDPRQESVLAALGVQGSPKTIFPTPGPAFGPSHPAGRGVPPPSGPPSRNSSRSVGPHAQYQTQRNMQFNHAPYGPGHFPIPPPPPEPERSPSYDPWKKHDASSNTMFNRDSPKSTTSQHTAVGSDFHADDDDDHEMTPKARPPLERTASSRKRTYDQVAEPEGDGRRRQYDDVTPRTHRNRPPLAAAYSRR